MLKFKKYMILPFIMFFPVAVFSDAYIDVYLNKREVEIGKILTLTVEMSDNVKDFQMPKMPDFIVLPKNDYEKNGRIIRTYDITPKSVGFFTVPSVIINDSGKEISSNPINVKVFERKISQNKTADIGNSSTFVEAYSDINAVYVNQQMQYTLKFATKFDLASNPNYVLPMFKDFWKNKSKSKSGYRLINGENYFVFEVTTQLYPMRDGNVVIDPSSVSIEYLNPRKKLNFKTNTVTVKVFSLPETGRPDDFTGVVGKYYISSSVSKKSVKVNEPVTLSIYIKGNGNINAVSEPKILLPDDMKKYATTVKIKNDELMSSKKFQCVIIPLIEGQKTIPSISFSYFDPDLKDYVTTKTDEIKINVLEGIYKENSEGDNNNTGEDEKFGENYSGENIKPVEIGTELRSYKSYSITDGLLLFGAIPFALFFVYSLVYKIKLTYLEKDVLKLQKIKAHKQFLKCFQKAGEAIYKNDQFKFYFYIDMSVRFFLKSKTNYDYINMIKGEIKTNLVNLKINGEIIEKINDMLVKCEKFKFTSSISGKDEMEDTYNVLKYIIKEELDKIL